MRFTDTVPRMPDISACPSSDSHTFDAAFASLDSVRLMATTIDVLLVLFLATLIRSSLGFGEALVAVPLLSLRIPVHMAVPLAVLVSVTVAAAIVAQDWRVVQARSAAGLIAFTLPGIPIGIFALTRVNGHVIKAALGAIIIAFSLYSLLSAAPPRLRKQGWGWVAVFGFSAGLLGGAYGMNSPPLVVYGSMRRWKPAQFRATLQAYFLPASLVAFIGYCAAGLWTAALMRYYLLSLPVVFAAIVLGHAIHRRLDAQLFSRIVYVGLIAIGVLLLA